MLATSKALDPTVALVRVSLRVAIPDQAELSY